MPNADTPARVPGRVLGLRLGTTRAQGKGDEDVDVDDQGTHLQARRRRPRRHQPTHAVGTGLVVAGAAYCTVVGAVRLFHTARRRALRGMLLDLVPVLEEAKCVYWLDFGTLLGVYRDDDIILHDNDCDIGILNPDWPALEALLTKRLGGRGYWTKRVVASEDASASWLRLRSHLGMADLFGATLEDSSDDGSDAMLRINLGHGDCCDIPAHLVLPTARMRFRGVWMRVPGDVEGALAYRYGPTWQVPRYMDKGADTIEQQKLYARFFTALGKLGIRL